MKTIKVTKRQREILNALCEYGQTDLIAYTLGIKEQSVTDVIWRIMRNNGFPNRLTLALAWDRLNRGESV